MQATRTQRLTMMAVATSLAAIFVANAPHVRAGVVSYQLNWQTIVAGGNVHAQNACYRLSGTMGQTIVDPGNSTADTYTLFAGFWSAAPLAGQDQLFFSAFEDCIP